MLTVIRHKESYANKNGLYQGQLLDTSLSSFGIAQTLSIKLDNSFDYIYCSSALRARQTLELIDNITSYEYRDDLRERNWGLFEGHDKLFLINNYKYLYENRNNFDIKLPYGESYGDVYARVKNFINEIRSTILESNILVITHKTPALIIKELLVNIKESNFDFNEIFTYG